MTTATTLPDETPLLVFDDDCPRDRSRCTWGEFKADNLEGVDLEGVEAALVAGERYYGGGGATPCWCVRRND